MTLSVEKILIDIQLLVPQAIEKLMHIINSRLRQCFLSDEIVLLFSEKGKRTINDLKPKKMVVKASKAVINNEHVALSVTTAEHRDFAALVACKGRIREKQKDKWPGKWIGEKAEAICTNSGRSYGSFGKKKGLKRLSINVSRGQHLKDIVYHIQILNQIHCRIKDSMKRYKEVIDSDSMQNYMNWVRIKKKLAGGANSYSGYAITTNNSLVAWINMRPYLYLPYRNSL